MSTMPRHTLMLMLMLLMMLSFHAAYFSDYYFLSFMPRCLIFAIIIYDAMIC